MSNMMEYKEYLGSIEYSKEDDCLYGKVQGIRGLISYEGESLKELKEAFHYMVDEYLEDCKREGKEPQKPFKGGFNVRVNEELHRAAFMYAQEHDTTINNVVIEALNEKLILKKKRAVRIGKNPQTGRELKNLAKTTKIAM